MDLIELKSQRVLPEFARLADVPPEAQWFANLDSKQTRCAFLAFTAATGSGNWPMTLEFENPDATCDASSLERF